MTQLIIGEVSVRDFIENPDDYLEEFDTLGINDSRRLRQLATLKQTDRRLVIRFNAITVEAQNALLKTLEEPAVGNHFILITPSLGSLLPTFLSRCKISRNPDGKANFDLMKRFVDAEPSERLEIVGKIINDEDKAKGVALQFLNNLERYLARDKKNIFVLEQIRIGRDYLQDKAGLPRLILEHVALVL